MPSEEEKKCLTNVLYHFTLFDISCRPNNLCTVCNWLTALISTHLFVHHFFLLFFLEEQTYWLHLIELTEFEALISPMEFSIKLKVQTYLSAVVLQFAPLAACYSCTYHMHCIRKYQNKSLKVTVTQMHANTVSFKRVSFSDRKICSPPPTLHPHRFCLNVVKKWLTTRPPEKESVSEKDHQCEGVQGEGEIENWKQLMSNMLQQKKEQAQKQTMKNSSTLYFSQSFQAPVSAFFHPFAAPFLC